MNEKLRKVKRKRLEIKENIKAVHITTIMPNICKNITGLTRQNKIILSTLHAGDIS